MLAQFVAGQTKFAVVTVRSPGNPATITLTTKRACITRFTGASASIMRRPPLAWTLTIHTPSSAAARRAPAGKRVSLEDVILAVLKKAGGRMSFKDLHRTIVKGKLYKSKATKFDNVLRRTLSTSKKVKRVERGVYAAAASYNEGRLRSLLHGPRLLERLRLGLLLVVVQEGRLLGRPRLPAVRAAGVPHRRRTIGVDVVGDVGEGNDQRWTGDDPPAAVDDLGQLLEGPHADRKSVV